MQDCPFYHRNGKKSLARINRLQVRVQKRANPSFFFLLIGEAETILGMLNQDPCLWDSFFIGEYRSIVGLPLDKLQLLCDTEKDSAAAFQYLCRIRVLAEEG